MKTPKFKKEQVIEALRNNAGFKTGAAKALGCSLQTIQNYVRNNKKIRTAYEDLLEEHLDFAESKLLTAIRNGEPWSIAFFLKCKGKGRGYIERQEHTGKDGGPIETKSEFDLAKRLINDENANKLVHALLNVIGDSGGNGSHDKPGSVGAG